METNQNRRSWTQFTQSQRDRMQALLDAGEKQCVVAKILKVSPSRICRERKRKKEDGRYDAEAAHRKARVKRLSSKYQGMKVEKNAHLKRHIIRELRKKRSPDEIAGRMKREKMLFCASKNAIYKWLYSVYGQKYCKHLCMKRKRKKKQKMKTARVPIQNRRSIWDRPLGAANRTRYGHFEGDTIVAPKRAGNTEAIAIVVERKSKLLIATKIPSLSPREMTKAMNKFEENAAMLSVTMDNGIENRHHESWNVLAWFADAHAPSQKPIIEGSIGLVRRWYFKKGTDWKRVSEKRLQNVVRFINHKYRKSLKYQSAIEVAAAHGSMKKKSDPSGPEEDCN